MIRPIPLLPLDPAAATRDDAVRAARIARHLDWCERLHRLRLAGDVDLPARAAPSRVPAQRIRAAA